MSCKVRKKIVKTWKGSKVNSFLVQSFDHKIHILVVFQLDFANCRRFVCSVESTHVFKCNSRRSNGTTSSKS